MSAVVITAIAVLILWRKGRRILDFLELYYRRIATARQFERYALISSEQQSPSKSNDCLENVSANLKQTLQLLSRSIRRSKCLRSSSKLNDWILRLSFVVLVILFSLSLLVRFIQSTTAFWLWSLIVIGLSAFLIVVGFLNLKYRCLILLTLIEMSGKRVCSAMLVVAFAIAFRTPVENVTNNWDNMAATLGCFHNHSVQIKDRWVKWVNMPFVGVAKELEKYYQKIKKEAIKMRNDIKQLLDGLSFTQVKIIGISDICSDILMNLAKRCSFLLEYGYEECKKLYGALGIACEAVKPLYSLCDALKVLEKPCTIGGELKKSIIEALQKKVRIMFLFIEKELTFTIDSEFIRAITKKVSYSDASKTLRERITSIVDWLKICTKALNFIPEYILGYIAGCYGLYRAFLRAKTFLKKFNEDDGHYNYFVTRQLRVLNYKKYKEGNPSVLPVHRAYQKFYTDFFSTRLTKNERKRSFLIIFWFIFKIAVVLCILGFDIGFWKFLSLMNVNVVSQQKQSNETGKYFIKVSGTGATRELYEKLVQSLLPPTEDDSVQNTELCKIKALEPNWTVHGTVIVLLFSSLIMVMMSPYLKRMRHKILEFHFPDKKQSRTSWLYNELSQKASPTRSRNIRNLLKPVETNRFLSFSAFKTSACMRRIASCLGFVNYDCSWCDKLVYVRKNFRIYGACLNPDCSSIFCDDCYVEIKSKCPLCSTNRLWRKIRDERLDSALDLEEFEQKKEPVENRPADTEEDRERGGFSEESDSSDSDSYVEDSSASDYYWSSEEDE